MKRVLLLVLAACGISSLQAVDFGVNIDNVTGLTGEATPVFAQRDKVSAWFSWTAEDLSLLVEGFYQFKADIAESSSVILPFRMDVANLWFQAQFPDFLGDRTMGIFRIGRFDFSDSATKIFNATSDGLSFRITYNTLELALSSAYTGLSAQQDANVIISTADFNDYANPADPANPPYFAPNRMFVGLKGKVLELFERHDLSLDLYGQFDFRPTDPLNTWYAELTMDGRPLQWFKWRGYVIGELWGDAITSASMAAGAKFQFTVPDLLGLIAVLNVDWASGGNTSFRQYGAINQNKVAQIYPAIFADIVSFNLNSAFRPSSGFGIGINATTLLRASDNAPADPDFPAGASSPYLGTEAVLNVDMNLSSEFKLSVKGGAFFPNTADDGYGAAALPTWLASLELLLKI